MYFPIFGGRWARLSFWQLCTFTPFGIMCFLFLCPHYRMVRGHIALVMSVRQYVTSRTYVPIWFSSYDQVSPGCCNFCFPSWNLFIFGSCLLIIILLHHLQDAPPLPNPKGKVVHLYLWFSSCDQVSPGFCFPSWNDLVFQRCLANIILLHSTEHLWVNFTRRSRSLT